MENEKIKALLSNSDIREEFGLGRDLTTRISRLLPHIKMGRSGRGEQILVKRADFERLIDRAATDSVDLWEMAKQHTPDSLQEWLSRDKEGK